METIEPRSTDTFKFFVALLLTGAAAVRMQQGVLLKSMSTSVLILYRSNALAHKIEKE